jgi:hypothetical protein
MSESVQRTLVETLLFLIGLLVSFGLPWLAWRRLRSGRPSATPLPIVDDGEGGKIVPLIAAFGGIRGLPWMGWASNTLNPRLIVTADGITYRLTRLRSCGWRDILLVDVRSFGATVLVRFTLRDSVLTFDANVGSTVLATQTLALLPDQVALTDRARSLLDEDPRPSSLPGD